MPRYFLRLAYRGTNYHGWQRQSGGLPTVQQTIEETMERVNGYFAFVVGCGRTDKGVHASDYLLHFDAEAELRPDFVEIMNYQLPDDIVVYDQCRVDSGAHTRYGATERTYDYYLHTRRDPFKSNLSSHYPLYPPPGQQLEEALGVLVGNHDFRAFCLTPDRHNTTSCALRAASFHDDGNGNYHFRFTADRYLRGMIRMTVGRMIDVWRGELTVARIAEALETGERISPKQAYPEGLYLSEVVHPAFVSSRHDRFQPHFRPPRRDG